MRSSERLHLMLTVGADWFGERRSLVGVYSRLSLSTAQHVPFAFLPWLVRVKILGISSMLYFRIRERQSATLALVKARRNMILNSPIFD